MLFLKLASCGVTLFGLTFSLYRTTQFAYATIRNTKNIYNVEDFIKNELFEDEEDTIENRELKISMLENKEVIQNNLKKVVLETSLNTLIGIGFSIALVGTLIKFINL